MACPHKKKANWTEILELSGLDDYTLARKLKSKLKAKKTEFYHGLAVAECEDNGVQMRAIELLADLRGRRKAAVDVHHDGAIGGPVVRIYLPDNGRDVPPDEKRDE